MYEILSRVTEVRTHTAHPHNNHIRLKLPELPSRHLPETGRHHLAPAHCPGHSGWGGRALGKVAADTGRLLTSDLPRSHSAAPSCSRQARRWPLRMRTYMKCRGLATGKISGFSKHGGNMRPRAPPPGPSTRALLLCLLGSQARPFRRRPDLADRGRPLQPCDTRPRPPAQTPAAAPANPPIMRRPSERALACRPTLTRQRNAGCGHFQDLIPCSVVCGTPTRPIPENEVLLLTLRSSGNRPPPQQQPLSGAADRPRAA